MMYTDYVLGFVVGVCAGVTALLLFFVLKKKQGGFQYDERQQLGRGAAFKWAFVALCGVYTPANLIAEMLLGHSWCADGGAWMLGGCLGLLVYVLVCIHKNAYVALNENATRIGATLLCLGALNVGLGVVNLFERPLCVKDGQLQNLSANLPLGLVLLVTVAAMAVHTQRQKEAEEE